MTPPPLDRPVADPIARVVAWRDAGRQAALATVVRTWGSSPRPAGSQLAIDADGAFEGSVSGGCVEGSVVEQAGAVIESGRPQRLEFGVTDEMAWEVGLACGGEIEVWVERVPAATESGLLDALQDLRAAKRPVVASLDLATGERALIDPEAPTGTEAVVLERARDALRSDACREVEREGGRLFLQPFNPPLRLVVVGAVHIAQPLARMATETGYEVVVVDPRQAFASEARFPGLDLRHDWPDEALTSLALDARTAVVTLGHDPKLDDPALDVALASPAFYVGALGSQRTQARRRERLAEQGHDEAALARIHGPVGLDIGARSPAEIAVSILAEMTAALRGGARR